MSQLSSRQFTTALQHLNIGRNFLTLNSGGATALDTNSDTFQGALEESSTSSVPITSSINCVKLCFYQSANAIIITLQIAVNVQGIYGAI